MISSSSNMQRRYFIRAIMTATTLWVCTNLLATTCARWDTPTLENPSPAIGEPLVFSEANAEDAAAAMAWKYSLIAGNDKQPLLPMRLDGGGRFIVINLPALQAGKNYQIIATPPPRCKLLCGKPLNGKTRQTIINFMLTEPAAGTIPWGLTLSEAIRTLRILPTSTLRFIVPTGPIAKGHLILVRVEQKSPQGSKTIAYNVIPTDDIRMPAPRNPYLMSGRACTNSGFVLNPGDSYSVSLYAGRHGKYETVSGWTFSIPTSPVWSADESAEFERQYKAAIVESNKCDQIGTQSDVEIRKHCSDVYDTLFSLELKRDEKNGNEFDYGADKLNLQPVRLEDIPQVSFVQ